MDAEGVKRLPVVDDLGRLVGIVSRCDLLKVHLRPDDDIHAEVTAGVLPTVPDLGEPGVAAEVTDGRVTLTGRVPRASTAQLVDRLTRQVAGVVEVVNELEYDFDDRTTVGTGVVYVA
jgi:CBS-domain-containing membrane protein